MARFTPEFLDRLRDLIPVSQIVGRRVKLNKKGKEQWGLCPFHSEKSPSFKVNDERGRYHCFGCGKDGDIVRFLTETEGLSFPEAVEKLALEAGLEIPREDPRDVERDVKRKGHQEIMELAAQFFQSHLMSGQYRHPQDYVLTRGLGRKTIELYRLGYAPEGNKLKAFMAQQNVDEQDLIDLCLLRRREDGSASYDFFRDRLMFPIADRRGKIIAFGGRVLSDAKPKYLNSSDTPLFNKSVTLFGLSQARQAIHANKTVLVAEGYMDVIAMAQAGFRHAVAPLGTALTEGHLDRLWRLTPEPIMCLDGDDAGQAAAQRAAVRALPLLKPGQSLRFLLMPEGQDPDDFLKDQGASAFSKKIADAIPLIQQLWTYSLNEAPYDTPERQTALWTRLADIANQVGDGEVAAAYRARLRQWYEAAFQTQAPTSNRGSARKLRTGHKRFDWRKPAYEQDLSPVLIKAAGLRERRLEGLLLTLSNHFKLLEPFAEALAQVEIPDKSLANWRQSLLELALDDPSLDTEGTEAQITSIVEQYCPPERRRQLAGGLVPFSARDASAAAARDGIEHLLASLQENQARSELKLAQVERLKSQLKAQTSGSDPAGD